MVWVRIGSSRNGEPEDELRRLVIAYYLADDEVAVFEVGCLEILRMGSSGLSQHF